MTEVHYEVHYEVQHFTLVDGWVNCWSVFADDDSEMPSIFGNLFDAEGALEEFFEERPEEDHLQYRVVEVRNGVVVGVYPYDQNLTYENGTSH